VPQLVGEKTSSLLTNSTSFEHTSETHPGGRGVLDSKRYGAIAGAGVFNAIVFLPFFSNKKAEARRLP
jgi:hypothetical protein